MNLEVLTTEMSNRGFDYLTTSRLTNYVNDAYLIDICEAEDWEFLRSSAEGTAPLEIEDLRSVESVIDSTQERKLRPLDPREITDSYNTDLETTGTPAFYYQDGEDTIRVYPVSTTDTIKVRYYKIPVALSGTASPIFHSRFHTLIVDFAVARAYEDSDDYELGMAAKENAFNRLQAMRESLMSWNSDAPHEYISIVDPGVGA